MFQDLNNSSDQSNTDWKKNSQEQTSLLFSLILYFAYGIIFLIGLIANIFVIVVIIKFRRMRTLTNRFLLNLAISDLLATLICLPPTAYHHHTKSWTFGEFLCRFVPFIQGTSVAVSIFTLMAVSVDRFIAIHKPLHSKVFCTSMRIIVIIGAIWIAAFLLMIPLIVHHRIIIDLYKINFRACAEVWQQNMNARLAYDFILLFVLFILPLTLMAYCYIRISFSLWFIDPNTHMSLSSSSIANAARFSTISEDFPQIDINDIRRLSSQKNRPYYIHYHKTYENDPKRKQQQQQQQQQQQSPEQDELHSLINAPNRTRSTTINDIKPKSASITATTMTAHTTCRRSSSLIGHRFGENGFVQQARQIPTRHRHSTSPYASGILRSSLTSLQSQNRMVASGSLSTNGNPNHSHRSTVEFERASRFLQSRRRVVRLLITLVAVFFLTRLPLHILTIYIDITSHSYIPPVNTYSNRTDAAAVLSSHVINADKKMTLVWYVNPILQLCSLSNSAINPLCYCVMSHAVKNLITVVRQKLRRRGQKKSAALPLTQRPVAPKHSIKMIINHKNSLGNDGLLH